MSDSKQQAINLLWAAMTAAVSGLVLAAIAASLDPIRKQARISNARRKELARRLGRTVPPLTVYEEIIATDIVNPCEIRVNFDSIGGLEHVKDELRDLVILPLQRPDLFEGNLLKPQKGILLYGPPGTGKTLLAKALAKESQAVFINVRMSNLMSKWFGEGQRLVAAVFTLANKLQPSIIFVDEVDSFLGERGRSGEHEAVASMKTEFMTQWDGFATNENARVMVLCATNRPWDLDEAILRRTSRSFEIPLPDVAGRTSILKKLLQSEKVEPDVNVEVVADKCVGLSGSDLNELCRQVALIPVKDLMREERRQVEERRQRSLEGGPLRPAVEPGPQGTKRPIRQQDFMTVLAGFKPSQSAARAYRDQLRQATSSNGPTNPSGSGVPDLAQVPSQGELVRYLFLNWLQNHGALSSQAV